MMAYPQVASYAITTPTTSATTYAVNMPSGVVAGDVVLIWCGARNGSGTAFASTGFTSIITAYNSAYVAVLAKESDGSEGATVNVTLDNDFSSSLVFIAFRVTGADINNIEAAKRDGDGFGSPSRTPAITASWGADDNLFLLLACSEGTGVGLGAIPSGVTEIASQIDGEVAFHAGYIESTSGTQAEIEWSFTDIDYPQDITLAFKPGAVTPTLTVTQTELTPGGTISGSYSNYATVPTTLTVSDGTNTITIASPTITDNGDGTGTFSGTMPSLPSSGTASLIQFTNSATVELS